MKKKTFALLLALVLVFGVAAGGTLAWLTDKTSEVKNTFTYGDINITLAETTGNSYKIIPGVDIAKDPKVTVKAGSEKCWLFVKVVETGTFVKDRVTYELNFDDTWTKGTGNIPATVYYKAVDVSEATNDFTLNLLKDNKITVSSALTKGEIKDITAPTLSFQAAAVQYAKSSTANFTAEQAFDLVKADLGFTT